MDADAAPNAELEASFDRALSKLYLAYQPIVSVQERRIVAFEALLRSGEPGLLRPDEVLIAAERLGRVRDVARRVHARVAADMTAAPPDVDVFVNLHARDLVDDSLIDDASPLAPWSHRIVLEITERAAFADPLQASARALQLREQGFRIAVDDLGAGYAGLSYFALLTPEVVKVDLSLVRDLDRSPVNRKVVGSIVAICRELGVAVVAEGIERAEERDAALEVGCDLLQGFHFARPGPAFPKVTFPSG